jgi:hypothetical protein
MRSGAFGSRLERDRVALAWALGYAPLLECTPEVRAVARLELVFRSAMVGRLRPLHKCSSLELAAAAQLLPATSSATQELAPPVVASLPNSAAAGGLQRRG